MDIVDLDQMTEASARTRTVRAADLEAVERLARLSAIQEGFRLVREGNSRAPADDRPAADARGGNLLLFERDVRYDAAGSREALARSYLPHALAVVVAIAVGAADFFVLRSPFLYLGVGLVVAASAVAVLQSTPPLRFHSELLGVRLRRTSLPSSVPPGGSVGLQFEVAVAGGEVESVNRRVGRAPRSSGRYSRTVLLHRADPDCAAAAERVLGTVGRLLPDPS